jgi:hypothetical protein
MTVFLSIGNFGRSYRNWILFLEFSELRIKFLGNLLSLRQHLNSSRKVFILKTPRKKSLCIEYTKIHTHTHTHTHTLSLSLSERLWDIPKIWKYKERKLQKLFLYLCGI